VARTVLPDCLGPTIPTTGYFLEVSSNLCPRFLVIIPPIIAWLDKLSIGLPICPVGLFGVKNYRLLIIFSCNLTKNQLVHFLHILPKRHLKWDKITKTFGKDF